MTIRSCFFISLCAVAVMSRTTSVSSQTPSQRPPARPSAPVTQPKFKAIWERVPFNKDIGLKAVACSGPETCWVVGDRATILHTINGGKTWDVQLGGDTEATDEPLTKIFALDANHAWAMNERGKILGTADGHTWVELSDVSGTTKGVWFVSPKVGLEIENPDSTSQSTIRRSEDGGKSWKPTSRCSVETTIDGQPRKLDCRLATAQFVSSAIGFIGGEAATGMGSQVGVFGKTADAGQTWVMSVIPETKRRVTGLHFWSEKEGIAVLDAGEEVHWTVDGGGTWTRSVRQRLWPSYYGCGEGKLIVGAVESGREISYSVNGGRNFTTRAFGTPASVRAVTFFDSKNGYLIGDHAMAYRYRIVPSDYSSPGMLPAIAP